MGRAQALYDRWQSEVTRIAELVQSGVIDVQTRDETQNQFKAAEAARNEATAKVASAEAAVTKAEADRDKAAADVDAAEARLEVAKAEVGRLAALLGYTKITRPVRRRGDPPGGEHRRLRAPPAARHGLFTRGPARPGPGGGPGARGGRRAGRGRAGRCG